MGCEGASVSYTLWIKNDAGLEIQVDPAVDEINYAPGGFWTYTITGDDLEEMIQVLGADVMERSL